MTTSNKNFKIKNGLEVLGTSATVNGNDVLTIASSINALADVDLTGAVAGNSLVFDASLNLIPGDSGGIAKYIVSDTKPVGVEEGVVWYNSVTGETFIYIVDEDSEQFVEVGTFGPAGATGPQGPAGADGADSTVPGPQGEQGESGIVAQPEPPEDTTVLWYDTDAPGYGIPLGGTTGQVLSKVDSVDFNTEWTSPYTQDNADFDIANVQTAIVGGAPSDLNTLGKISSAIGDDPDFVTTINNELDIKSNVGHVHAIESITNLQAELNSKALASHDHNNLYYTKLQSDAALNGKSNTGHIHDDRYYTEAETDTAIATAIANLVDSAPSTLDTLNELSDALADDPNFATTMTNALAGKSDTSHLHDDRYYTETETDTLLSGKSDTSHTHDDRYYTESEVSTLLETLLPAGTINQTARSTAPSGWLLCEGQTVSRSTYAKLFDAIGVTYGAGDGSTTFTLPNMQGRVAVGKNTGTFSTLGATGGAETHTLTVDQMPSHTHIQNAHNHTQDAHNHSQNAHSHSASVGVTGADDNNHTGNGDYVADSDAGYRTQRGVSVAATTATNNATTATNQATTATNQNTGGGQAHNNLQPYIVLNYMIKI